MSNPTLNLWDSQRAAWEAANTEQHDEQEALEPTEVPEPEVRATPIDIGDERLPGGAKQVINLARKNGWTAAASYARGPWLHATRWAPVGICDHVVVRFRIDGSDKRAVASWRDGAFETAWVRTGDYADAVNSKTLKRLLKGETEEEEGPTTE